MPGPLSVECPQCGAKLKLKDRSKLGKKAACPQCRKPFVLTAPPEDDELDEFADLGDYEDAEYAGGPNAPTSVGFGGSSSFTTANTRCRWPSRR